MLCVNLLHNPTVGIGLGSISTPFLPLRQKYPTPKIYNYSAKILKFRTCRLNYNLNNVCKFAQFWLYGFKTISIFTVFSTKIHWQTIKPFIIRILAGFI